MLKEGGALGQKPILLLADSQNLFWQLKGRYFLSLFFEGDLPQSAAYIGASNDDRAEYFEIFKAAMDTAGIRQKFFIRKTFDSTDRQHLQEADLILLAGGDIQKGWHIIKKSGMAGIICDRFYHGAYLMGISAGAVQIGLVGFDARGQTFETLKCLPLAVDVHQESDQWQRLKTVLQSLQNQYVQGIGLPKGSGIIYHPDHSIEAVRKPVSLFEQTDSGLKQHLLLPAKYDQTTINEVSES